MRALLIVDVQNDFCPGGALPTKGGDEVVSKVNQLRHQFPLVVFTQDWHPPDHLSFASNHPGKKVGGTIELEGLPQILWPEHCIQNSWGARFHPELQVESTDPVFRKGMDRNLDSYSAFFDNARRKGTGLDEFLKQKGVKDLAVCGLATEYCVKFSALDALAEGFKVELIAEACRGVEAKEGDCEQALRELRRAGVILR